MASARGSSKAVLGAALAVSLLALASRAAAQDDGPAIPAVDPYTKGDPAALETAGYVSFGPFRWGDDVTSERVASALGGETLLWVETAHFRLGSALEAYDFPVDRVEKKRLEGELARLKQRLPGIKAKPKELDPWLRLHLFAQRIEELYTDFQETFGLTDADPRPPQPGGASALGAGPYLGMQDKFSVLLVEKRSTLARYTATFCGGEWGDTFRFYFQKSGGLFAGLSVESLGADLQDDLTFQYAVAFILSHNLYAGFRGYDGEGPTWWQEGLGRWFARRIDERCLIYTAGEGELLRGEEEARWGPKVRARVENRAFPRIEEMFAWEEPGGWEYSRHMMTWSRVDFVLHAEPERRRAFLEALQEPAEVELAARPALVAERTRRAFEALGYDPDDLSAFDRDWAAWVVERYPRR
jgi:hypothetical protein